jgi:flagellar FliL protein
MWKTTHRNLREVAGAEAPAAQGAGETPGSGAGGLFPKKLIVALVVGLALAGGGIGAAKFLGQRGGRQPKKVVSPLTMEFSELVVNIDVPGLTRVLRCVIHVEVDDPKAIEELRLREVAYRDVILNVLRSKTLDDLKYPGENAIKRQIRDRFNRMLTRGSVVKVYLKEFLIH